MAVGPRRAGSGRGSRGIVQNGHSKQPDSKSSARFYVFRPIHGAPAIPACHKKQFAHIWPANGQTAENRAKPSPPSHSPLDLGLGKKFLWPNGLSRRTRLSHKTLPRQAGVRVASDAGHMPVARAPPVGLPISYTSSVAPPSQMRWSPPS
jgi:hypothetical protein